MIPAVPRQPTLRDATIGKNPLPPHILTVPQFVRSLAIGAVLWLIAAMILRVIGPMGAFVGDARLLTYALIIPGTLPFVLVIPRLAGIDRCQMVPCVAAATLAAALLDGIALAWFPSLYGRTIGLAAGAGATILWGIGVGLVMAFVIAGKRT